MRLSIIPLFLIVLIATGLASCSGDGNTSNTGKLSVITTLPLFADFVREVGGDRVEVTPLVPTGTDPHTWEPSPSDIRRVTQADIAFANGLNLEPSAIKVIEPNLGGSAGLVVLGEEAREAGAAVSQLPEGFEEESEEHGDDPHLWMDASNTALYAGIIRDVLVEKDPAGKSSYDDNYETFTSELEEVDRYVAGKVGEIPEENRKLVTTHDAFGYFASGYRLRIVAFVAPGPGQEASPEDIAQLTRAMQDENVPAVFVEPQIESQGEILRQAAEDAGIEICTLYSDSLDDRVTSYIELMRFNADELTRCLGEP
jgi:ABC-type Zn uptake system ZnuABC Zn-binding protein ZnuA